MTSKQIVVVFLFTILFSYSSDEYPITEPQEKSFTVQLVTTNTSVNIDEIATFEKN
ncbi:hypothetical protein [Tenacibaculum maritimum]|uniref:hypothetical protein n=1 Tax=Tenacibaculum maritimum TaxID=107401 RepID=UPI0013308894|nr:hypothetical protein [Tenacibaculum maritimum]